MYIHTYMHVYVNVSVYVYAYVYVYVYVFIYNMYTYKFAGPLRPTGVRDPWHAIIVFS